MALPRHVLKALGLSAMLFGLMAFGSSAAQAADWDVGGVKLDAAKLKVALGAKVETHLILLVLIGIIEVEILCTKVTPIDFLLLNEGRSLGKLLFEGCVTILNKATKPTPACLPKTGGGVDDHITTELIEGELILKGSEDLVKLTPEEASGKLSAKFVKIEFGPTCPLGLSMDVTGTLNLKDCKNLALTAAVTHLVEEEVLGTALKAGSQPAHIDGSTELFLTGVEHTGKTWNALNI